MKKENNKQIVNEQVKKVNIKLRIIIIIISLLLLFIIFFLYGRYIETNKLIVNEYKITNSIIPNSFHGKKIIHFSDLHYKSTIDDKYIKKLVENINVYKPDIVIFTGDLLNSKYNYNIVEKEFLTNQLNMITSSLGKYYITGEDDTELASDILNNSKFIKLDNTSDKVYNYDNNYIEIFGISNLDYINTSLDNTNLYKIVISHYPDYISNYKTANLFLSGHSHHNQIWLPFTNGLITKDKATTYNQDYYKVDDTELYISSGLGTTNIKVRLFNPPSINLYRLTNK